MIDLTLNYILPNIALFGGLYAIGKGFEMFTWKFILWYCDNY
jgi:hypothetical protein